MNIKIVTAPDIVHGYDPSLLLICPTEDTKNHITRLLKDVDTDLNIYIYEEDTEPEWLLAVVMLSDNIFVEVDQMPSSMKDLASYLLGFNKTFWLTKGENIYYNKINSNRVWDIEPVVEKLLGVSFEKQ